MSVQRCQQETTSSEFIEWRMFFEQEFDIPKREDYFLAQIAAEVRRTIARNPNAVRLDHFLLKFKTPQIDKPPSKLSAAEREQRNAISKARWFAITGADKKEVK